MHKQYFPGIATLALCAMLAALPLRSAGAWCCYVGDLTRTSLDELTIELENGDRASFLEIFSGYQPSGGFFHETLPVRDIDIGWVTRPKLAAVLPEYDANNDGLVQQPELLVLYVLEGARGLGFDAVRLDRGGRVQAIQIPSSDIGGLMSFVKNHKQGMSQDAQQIWYDLEYLGLQWRSRGSENGRAGGCGPRGC